MQTSSDFQTSGLVLLVATVVFGVFAALLLTPMLKQDGVSSVAVDAVPEAEVSAEIPPGYAEFFPNETQTVKSKLETVTAMSGRPANMEFAEQRTFVPQGSDTAQAASHNFRPPMPAGTAPPYRTVSQPPVVQPCQSPPASCPAQQKNHAPVTQSGAPPIVQSFGGLPSGSVYAPVTVNLDGSLLMGQVQAVEERLTDLIDRRIPSDESDIRRDERKKIARANRRDASVAKLDERQAAEQDESLHQINSGLQRLTQSLEHLEQRTTDRLMEIARQTALREAQSRHYEQEWRSLLEARISAAEVAQRTRVAAAAPLTTDERRTGFADTEFRSDSGFATVPTDTPVIHAPARVAQQDAAAESFESFEDLVPLPRETSPARTIDTVPTVPAVAPKIKEPTPAPASSTSLPARRRSEDQSPLPGIEFPEDPSEVEVDVDVKPEPELQKFVPYFEPESDSRPEQKPAPKKNSVDQTSFSALTPVPISESSSDIGSPQPATKNTRIGFEQVYRFQIDDIQAGDVRPAAEACPRCGKTHPGICQVAAAAAQAIERHPASPTAAEANVTKSKKKSSNTKRYIPGLKLPSLTTNDQEPGILHRLGSSIRHFGRSTVE